MGTESSRGLLVAILIVSGMNLLVAAVQVGLMLRQPTKAASEASPTLPKQFTDAELSNIAHRVTEPYNRGDMDALYDAFDDLAKNQLPRSKLEEQLGQVAGLVGKVDSAAYSGFQKLPSQGGLDMYQLNYVVKLSGGRFNSGVMTVSVVDRTQTIGIVGFFINGRTQ